MIHQHHLQLLPFYAHPLSLQVGRLPVGEHPLWGAVYIRWWAGKQLLGMATSALQSCQGTPLHNMLLRLMGAQIGHNVVVDSTGLTEPECIVLQVIL